jgi:hypothetical protein
MQRPTHRRALYDGGFRDSGITPPELAWGVPSPSRSNWPARIAVLCALGLYLVLPNRLVPGPRFVVPVLEAVILVTLSLFWPHHTMVRAPLRRLLALLLIALVSTANLINLLLLVNELLKGNVMNGRELIVSSLALWTTNVIVFALWYWELDRGGPYARHQTEHREPDFLFPQMTTPGAGTPIWAPSFVDYLFISLTNATAFSPTDTMPLTVMAKALMGAQALTSLLTVAVVAARAVNILR